jgi:Mn2+/Fe2+ NRAMP family transporter
MSNMPGCVTNKASVELFELQMQFNRNNSETVDESKTSNRNGGTMDELGQPSFPRANGLREGESVAADVLLAAPRVRGTLGRFLAVMGPGLAVMLADTDVGSIVTAGQSGVQWGYRLLLAQFLLIPLLYIVQELTVRLGIYTGRGHGELILAYFGRGWAALSVGGLAVAVIGALITEFSGVVGVGELFGIPRGASLLLAVLALLAVVLTGSYRRVERAAIVLGLFELAFFGVAWQARPAWPDVWAGAFDIPFSQHDYWYLLAANIGAVIMPWMIFYQQSAITDKKLGLDHLGAARLDTVIGSVLTQLIMAAVLIAAAATIGRNDPSRSLNSVGEISQALTPFLGAPTARVVFGLGVLGAAMVAAVVASLALAWGLGEVTGFNHTLEAHPLEAGWFYGSYAFCTILGAAVVYWAPNLVALNIGVEVMNALLLPLVLGFLIALAARVLPHGVRLRGWYLWLVVVLAALTAALGIFGAASGANLV